MPIRYTSKSVITMALGTLLAPSLVAQHSLTLNHIANHAGTISPDVQFGGTPVNDDCSGALVVPLAVGTPEVRTGDNTGATDSYGFGNEVWEAFTLTECADVLVEFCGTVPAFTGMPLPNLFIGCPLTNLVWIGNENVIVCGDGNFSFHYRQLSPGTYYLPVYQAVGSTGPYQVTFTATACSGEPPENDDCSGAVVLTPDPVCLLVDGDVANANISGGSIAGDGCSGGDPSDDVWYSFVATSADHSIVVDPSDLLSVVIELHANDCSGTNLIDCLEGDNFGTNEQMDATGLTVGATYYVRIYDWYSGPPVTTRFDICLLGPSVCAADAGTLTALNPEICFDGQNRVRAESNGDANVPSGYSIIYLLTTAPDFVIMQMDTLPEFNVTALGSYTVHALVFNPATLDTASIVLGSTTALDVNAILLQGGGEVCGSLDLLGAAFEVIECIPCDADAGTLTAEEAEVCLVEGSAMISGTPDGNSNVPLGHTVAYLLTLGPDVVVDGAVFPDFEVTATGDYFIHTLVYDPNTFDLGSIQLGVTTISDIDTALVQGGGEICASLDIAGAHINVSECAVCEANAGTLTGGASPVCLLGGTADISATGDGNMVVPAGFDTLYVLAQGAGLVIIAMDVEPSFSVTGAGAYAIHTLVYDPLTLDTAGIDLGATTVADLDTLLVQGGGAICADLDVIGASFQVDDCAPANDDCDGAVALAVNAVGACPGAAIGGDNTYATHDGADPACDPSTDGYSDVWYSFNSGDNTTVTLDFGPGTMEDWGIEVLLGCNGNDVYCEAQPQMPVDLPTVPNSTYVIRVYSNLQFGAGGIFTICLSGSATTVACDGGTVETVLGSVAETICQDATADVIGFATTSSSAENYAFILTDADGIIVALLVGNSLDFNSAPLGNYQVWGVSYNGDLENAVPGASIDTLSSSGECLDLSSNFVEVTVEICDGITENDGAGWNIFPNPGTGNVTLSYSGTDALTTIDVIDMRGRIVHQEQATMVRGQRHALHLEGLLAQGVYSVRLANAGGNATLRMTVR